jgi:NTP pyrophosphatase (non-canonical NTP hydrolase)
LFAANAQATLCRLVRSAVGPTPTERWQQHVNRTIRDIQQAVHKTAVEHGWWEAPRPAGEVLMLMVTELAEAMEAYRRGNPESEKIPGFSKMEEELADVVIRLLDYAGGEGFDIEGALVAKMAYNETRPYRHGGKLA